MPISIVQNDANSMSASLDEHDILSTIASFLIDVETLAALSSADKTAHDAVAQTIAKLRYSVPRPMLTDRCPKQPWPITRVGHGSVLESDCAKEAMEAGAYKFDALSLESSYDNNVDGCEYIEYYVHTLRYEGEAVWSLTTTSQTQISGSFGASSSSNIAGDSLQVSLTHWASSYYCQGGKTEERRYDLKHILIGAALMAGAEAPLKATDIELR
eukprot:CAMPEP_0115851354 /NCGR_PEP_ID=MMETSP0287-20121206/12439_1 /TAXON_ID=412157 /ORGANISM="Chrysochromulina rotalis, Strain UIO044" /LENGTH=213 /DNA_ID=CAMNT_0003305385 /DNA_START=115 /DNA_END=756 /DNA_ORIENTATION=-